ncbi:hypothetical protein KM043_017511 [Ampulex compressa]|nr:hypothetical protein KM043_017511 [Ampulex compressa]
MKVQAIFCTIGALCVAKVLTEKEGVLYNAHVNSVLDMKQTLRTIQEDLGFYKDSLRPNLEKRLQTAQISVKNRIRNIISRILDEIQYAVTAANAEGKDAHHCYSDAVEEMESLQRVLESDLDRCVDRTLPTIRRVEHRAETMINACKIFAEQLNAIVKLCFSMDATRMNKCLSRKIAPANRYLAKLLDDLSAIKENGATEVERSYSMGEVCNLKPFLRANSTAVHADQKAVLCVIHA